VPHQERRRAANQLEAINDFVDGKDSNLRHSVVLIDHSDADSEMQAEQIQPKERHGD